MPSPTEQQIQTLREQIERYAALPRHTADAAFLRRLKSLQQWEVVNLRRRHATPCSTQIAYGQVLDYYLSFLHQGLPLDGLVERGPQGLQHARRMNKSFALFANAIEYSVLSAATQDKLVETLGDETLTSKQYALAVESCQDAQERLRRLDLLVTISHKVAPHLSSRITYTGFKLLKGMFNTVGLGEIHSSLDAGFKQLRNVSRMAQIMAKIAEVERQQLPATQEQRLTGTG